MSTSPSSELSCPLCKNTFRRVDHLSRHILSHTGDKPHYCPVCSKAFTRRDSLVRHIPAHRSGSSTTKFLGTTRIARACTNCARVRLKCDGLLPCERCRSKGNECTYPRRSRNRVVPMEELTDSSVFESPPSQTSWEPIQGSHEEQRETNTASSVNVAPDNPWDPMELNSVPVTWQTSLETVVAPSGMAPDANEESGPTVIAVDQAQETSIANPLRQANFVEIEPDSQTASMASTGPYFSWNDEFNILDMLVTDSAMSPFNTEGTVAYPEIPRRHGGWAESSDHARHPQSTGSQDGRSHFESHPPYLTEDRPQASPSDTSTIVAWPTQWDPTESDSIVCFPDMRTVSIDIIEAESYDHVEGINKDSYDRIAECMSKTVLGAKHYHAFQNPNLPPIGIFNCFIQLYFEHFHPTFPILHMPTFDPTKAPWQLLLAVAAIGSQYSKIPHANICAKALLELLLRALLDTTALNNSILRQLWFVQALILKCSGMVSCGDRRLLEMADANRNTSHTLCRRGGAFKRSAQFIDPMNLDPNARVKYWEQWIEEESLRRVGFCSFVSDIQPSLYFNYTPCVAVEELQQPLPCHEALWEAKTASSWAELCGQIYGDNRPSFLNIDPCIAILARGEELNPCVGDFARLILGLSVHARSVPLFRVFSNPLVPKSVFSDSALEQIRSASLSALNNIRSSRNSSLHPTPSLDCHVLLAAMLLCIPQSTILLHAHFFGTTATATSSESHQLNRWMEQEQGRMARSAVWYAGNLLGVLRERNADASYEPIISLLCIITLWTYSHLSPGASAMSTYGLQAPEPRERRSVIRLDRHADEATLAAWISGQQNLRGHLKGVGDISRPGAASRILVVGANHLQDLGTCGLAHELKLWLSGLQSRAQTT